MDDRPLPLEHVERWLSPHRFGVYLDAADADMDAALALYDWNAAMTTACLRDVGHFEVLIRNRYAAVLDEHHPDWTDPDHPLWSTEVGIAKTRQLQRRANHRTRRALRTAGEHVRVRTPGHVVANLTFGFWTALTIPPRTATTWTTLSRAVPGVTRGQLHDSMEKLTRFRNRLAHWEPVFSSTTGLTNRLREFERLFEAVDPEIAGWVGRHSQVVGLWGAVPAARLVVPDRDYLGRPVPAPRRG
jgi:hypothetical protein